MVRLSVARLAIGWVVLCFGIAVLVHLTERTVQPEMMGFHNALWWSIATATMVGYGDVIPVSTVGRLLASVLMVASNLIVILLVANITAASVAHRLREGSE